MNASSQSNGQVGLFGYGEVGRTLTEDLRSRGVAVCAYDLKLGDASKKPPRERARERGVTLTADHPALAAQADLIVSAVTASQAVTVAQQGRHFFQRVIEHGRRRAEEMREAAETVREAGLAPWSAAATAERQASMAALSEAGVFGTRGSKGFARSADWRLEADRLLAESRSPPSPPGEQQ
jgi:3-hydroxyisobutyrate dehydrogenase